MSELNEFALLIEEARQLEAGIHVLRGNQTILENPYLNPSSIHHPDYAVMLTMKDTDVAGLLSENELDDYHFQVARVQRATEMLRTACIIVDLQFSLAAHVIDKSVHDTLRHDLGVQKNLSMRFHRARDAMEGSSYYSSELNDAIMGVWNRHEGQFERLLSQGSSGSFDDIKKGFLVSQIFYQRQHLAGLCLDEISENTKKIARYHSAALLYRQAVDEAVLPLDKDENFADRRLAATSSMLDEDLLRTDKVRKFLGHLVSSGTGLFIEDKPFKPTKYVPISIAPLIPASVYG